MVYVRPGLILPPSIACVGRQVITGTPLIGGKMREWADPSETCIRIGFNPIQIATNASIAA
jgi:hypothetical protein